MAAILAFARAGKIDWTVLEFLDWFLCDFAKAAIVLIPEGKPTSYKRGSRDDTLPRTVHEKVPPRHIRYFDEGDTSRKFAKAGWVRCNVDDTNLDAIWSFAEQRVLVRK